MISGNGRHRRPRQAPALLVAAGVTGSAIAIPLLGAASAHAADGTTWDKVANCESGGAWSADPGNGYYGGLQISQDDWVAYGGTQYASSADQASRSQQIAVAEKILKDKGTSPWATCALLSGLTSNSGSVNVDPGVGDDGGDQSGDPTDPSGLPDPSAPAGTQGGDQDGTGTGSGTGSDSGTGSGTGSGKASTDPSSSPTQGSGKQTGKHASPNPGKHTGKPGTGTSSPDPSDPSSSDPSSSDPSVPATPSAPADGSATPAPSTGTPDNPQQTVGSWNLVDTGALTGGRHRGGNADESTANGQNDSNSGRHASRGPGSYIVREGDSLSAIADSLDVDGGWHALYAANKKVVGADPNHITAGQTLKVSDETDADQG